LRCSGIPGYALLQGKGFKFEAGTGTSIANLVRQCDGTRTPRESVEELAADAKVPFDAIAAGCLNVLRQMLQRGFMVLPE